MDEVTVIGGITASQAGAMVSPSGREILLGNKRVKCPNHRKFKGLRKPRTECELCHLIYQWARELKIKEKRYRHLSYNEQMADLAGPVSFIYDSHPGGDDK